MDCCLGLSFKPCQLTHIPSSSFLLSLSLSLLPSLPSSCRDAWKAVKADHGLRYAALDSTLAEYQDPAKVDKIMKLDKQLAETKDILYKTIDAVLARGEKLEDLVEKSDHLSQQSKLFYKQAKKTNSCCSIM